MFSAWMKFSLDAARLGYDAARLGYEVQTVMTLRMLKLARGGHAAVRSRVNQNKRRLSK